jgi:hypothetical protein
MSRHMTVAMVSWKVVTYNLLKIEERAVPVLNHEDMWEGKGIAQQFLTSALEDVAKLASSNSLFILMETSHR